MSEALINKTEGSDLIQTECVFCDSQKNIKSFGIITDKIGGLYKFKFFGACEDHINKINKILSGEFHVDNIGSKNIKNVNTCNLRSLF